MTKVLHFLSKLVGLVHNCKCLNYHGNKALFLAVQLVEKCREMYSGDLKTV